MNFKLVTLGIVASLGFAACETTTNTNANRASNNSNTATVVNSNSVNQNSISPITTTNSNANTNRSSINYNGTAAENASSRTDIESKAKAAGDSIGQGAEDWWIWSKTKAAFTNSSLSSSAGINVDVANAMITLRGTVPKKEDITEADKIAKGISGQKGVKNMLKVGAGGSDTSMNGNANMGKGNMNKK